MSEMKANERGAIRVVEKAVDRDCVTDEQLGLINRYSRRELERDEVFVFSVTLCDNEVDRDFEQFPTAALEKLASLYRGKTGVFDHRPQAENQNARIFEAEVISGEGANSLGEDYKMLRAWAYMVRCEKNRDLILEIDGGIKKEVSVGCAVEKTVCSICGADQKSEGCGHQKGKEYGGKLCYHLLLNPLDAYEWSFVAVPAQKNAGVTKGYGGDGVGFWDGADVEKLFASGGDMVLTKANLDVLAGEFASLKAMASAGAEYLDSLRKDAVRAALLSQPELDPAVMAGVAEKMSPGQLREFARAFGKSVAGRMPTPQLVSPDRREDGRDGRFVI